MAEDSEASSKTEDATPRRLEEARREGNVAKSPEVSAWATLAAGTAVLLTMGGTLSSNLANQLAPFIAHAGETNLEGGGAVIVMRQAIAVASPFIIAVLAAAALAGAAGNVIQHGFLFTPSRLAPDPSRVSPLKGLERMFGIDGLMHYLRSLLKMIIVGVVAYLVLKPHLTEFQKLPMLDPMAMLPMAAEMIKAVVFGVLALLGIGAGLDWLWQRQRFMQRMRMTKEEIKEDFKQSEGDPHIKARIRQLRMQRAKKRMMQNVPKATVVVMNPTHYAVALRYESGETAAPICVAKGLDLVALKIREVAEAHNVPVLEDPPLARALYATTEIDETIPREHYEAVAKIIGFVMQQAQRRRRRAR
jgi:flagellar biosynthetic protein FlhB